MMTLLLLTMAVNGGLFAGTLLHSAYTAEQEGIEVDRQLYKKAA